MPQSRRGRLPRTQQRRARRRAQASAGDTDHTDDHIYTLKTLRETEKKSDKVVAKFKTDFGNTSQPGCIPRSAADVIVDYLTAEDRYSDFKTASTAEKRRMIGEMQKEMDDLSMDAATRTFNSIRDFIVRLVRDCSRANALEKQTGAGLSSEEKLWLDVQRLKGTIHPNEPD
ncbi:hypothetical protein QFC24_007122, partial [Naganishia onofrii]